MRTARRLGFLFADIQAGTCSSRSTKVVPFWVCTGSLVRTPRRELKKELHWKAQVQTSAVGELECNPGILSTIRRHCNIILTYISGIYQSALLRS